MTLRRWLTDTAYRHRTRAAKEARWWSTRCPECGRFMNLTRPEEHQCPWNRPRVPVDDEREAPDLARPDLPERLLIRALESPVVQGWVERILKPPPPPGPDGDTGMFI